jgi:nicotinate-nucleotide adenylyltransferase
MTTVRRLGFFGGTFNPIHRGHVIAAAQVRKRFSLERILFVPSFIPPHKTTREIASAEDRMAMVEIALRRRTRLVPSAVEIEAGGRSYSIRTLERLRDLYPGTRIFFLLGVDAFLEIETWREWKRVLETCFFIVMNRPGCRLDAAARVLGPEFEDTIKDVGASGRIREAWFSRYRIFLVPIRAADISSTDIRRRIHEGASIDGLVPPRVAEYIRARGLYLKTSTS